jgi:outer membrane receptor protein involved in Fe transport
LSRSDVGEAVGVRDGRYVIFGETPYVPQTAVTFCAGSAGGTHAGCERPKMRERVAMAKIAVVCLLSGYAWAQSALRGTVVDPTGASISGADIVITSPAGSAHAVTSADGRFSAAAAPPASVRVSRAGWQTAVADWTGGGDLRFVLQPARAEQQIVVTATRTPAVLSDVASSVSAITAADASSAPELAVDDILRQVPGFSLLRRSDSRTANPTSQGVSLRGLGASGASRALVLLDGVPLNDPFGGWVYWDRIPTAAIERIEVLRSGGSALYGSGALAGVVDVEERPITNRAIAFEGSSGNQGTSAGSLAMSAGGKRWGIAAEAQALQTDGYIPTPASQRTNATATAASARNATSDSARHS